LAAKGQKNCSQYHEKRRFPDVVQVSFGAVQEAQGASEGPADPLFKRFAVLEKVTFFAAQKQKNWSQFHQKRRFLDLVKVSFLAVQEAQGTSAGPADPLIKRFDDLEKVPFLAAQDQKYWSQSHEKCRFLDLVQVSF
jgi:hypothetical protein